MQINASEIESIEEAGELDKSPVKMLRTKGGFWIAVGKPKGKHKDEALAAGSHPAIVKFNLEKQYPNFLPTMMKSETILNPAVVSKHSRFLSEELLKSGHDVYSVQTGSNVEFQVTKYDVKVGTVSATLESDAMVVKKMNITEEFSHALAGATAEKALSCGVGKVRIQGK